MESVILEPFDDFLPILCQFL